MNWSFNLALALLLCLLATSCRTSPPTRHASEIRRAQPLLGTFIVITAHGTNDAATQHAIDAAFNAIRRVDSLMSLHRDDSELTRLNANAAAKPVTVSKELFHVIASAQRIAQETDGSFDVTIRPIADLWGFIWKQHRLPTPSEIETVLAHVGYQHVHLNPTNHTVHFARPEISIDLGAIAKGYAVDCATEKLRELGVTNALVRAGGDLRAMGHPRDRSSWEVQLEDPERQGSRTTIRLNNAALSTSGNYENFFVVDGRRYSHILNPRTGMPIEGVAACSVRAATCMESDAWATALFVQGPDQSLTKFGKRLAFCFTLSPPIGQKKPWPTRASASWDGSR